ncbi:MAG TPA: response regulator, partial [Bacteroidia bacterium]|nr:response regulator [Bacteroidia bacterium]
METLYPFLNMNSETDQVKVLLVEDNLLGREIAFSMLEDLGYKSRSAENGFAALQMLENESFDLVLMDVEMPVMNGISTTKQIRLKYGNKIPVIALTAHDSPGEQEKCLAAGMNACLVKPLEEKKLRAIVAQQLECRMNVEIENKNDAHAVASG